MGPRIRSRAVLALAAVLCGAGGAAATPPIAPPRTVLAIHAGAETYPGNPMIDEGIRAGLGSRREVAIDYYAEYLEADLFPGAGATLAFADYIRGKYEGRRIDSVIAVTGTALRFVLDHRLELFPDASIVFMGVGGVEEAARRAGVALTGVRVGTAYADTVRLALQLQPSTQRVFVVAAGPDEQLARAALAAVAQRVGVTYLDEPTLPGLFNAVRAIPPQSVILYIWRWHREPGNVIYTDEVARRVAAAAAVPVYATADVYLGTGVVGGVVRSTRETGVRLGEIALRILDGTSPRDIPIEDAPMAPMVDARQLQRWRIDASRLPAETRVLFREPTVWERYEVYIGSVIAALLIQSALIAALIVQRGRRRRAEEQVRRGAAALRKSYERVRDLGSRLLNAQEAERSRIARELHDDISQQLAVLTIDLTLLTRIVQRDGEAVAAEALSRVDSLAKSIHDLSHRLHPAKLRLIGLVAALEGLHSELSRPGVTITFTHEGIPPEPRPDQTLSLFRIAQEAMQNALKYSEARTVAVDLRRAADAITMTIADDGVGFDVEAEWGKGLGLISVGERVEAMGGSFEIRSTRGAGTRLEVRIPGAVADDAPPLAVRA